MLCNPWKSLPHNKLHPLATGDMRTNPKPTHALHSHYSDDHRGLDEHLHFQEVVFVEGSEVGVLVGMLGFLHRHM
jgi:hypothetical protein